MKDFVVNLKSKEFKMLRMCEDWETEMSKDLRAVICKYAHKLNIPWQLTSDSDNIASNISQLTSKLLELRDLLEEHKKKYEQVRQFG